jgi:hypothetical protein
MKCLPGGSAFDASYQDCVLSRDTSRIGLRQKSDFSSLRPWNSEILLQRKGTNLIRMVFLMLAFKPLEKTQSCPKLLDHSIYDRKITLSFWPRGILSVIGPHSRKYT